MSTTDAITDLTQAAKRVEESIALEEAKPNGGSLWRRQNLNAARLGIGKALALLEKDVERHG